MPKVGEPTYRLIEIGRAIITRLGDVDKLCEDQYGKRAITFPFR